MLTDEQVIGYQPKLKYSKEKPQTTASQTEQASSKSLSGLAESIQDSLPSNLFYAADFVNDAIEKLISKLNTNTDLNTFVNAIEKEKQEYVIKLLTENSDIKGDSVFEIIYFLKMSQKLIKNIVKNTKRLYYGNENMTDEEYQSIESSFLNKIKNYETTDDAYKINYALIYEDAKLNKALTGFSYMVNSQAIQLFQSYYTGEQLILSSSGRNMVEYIFNDIQIESEKRNRTFQEQEYFDLLDKGFYNYYSTRKDLNDLGKLCIETQESMPFILNLVDKKQKEVDESIQIILKHGKWYESLMSNVTETLSKKEQLRKAYNEQ